MANRFDYRGAKNEGYSDEEILDFLGKQHGNFDVQGALDEGYTAKDINTYLSNYRPKRSVGEKTARTAGQFALGLAEASPVGMSYTAAVAPLASKEAQQVPYRENLFSNIEDLQQRKELSPSEWTEDDETILQDQIAQAKHASLSDPYIQHKDISLQALAEGATGQDLEPEGVAEKAARWVGYIKNPENVFGNGVKNAAKAIAPTGMDLTRGIGAGVALEMAEENFFGPIGKMAAAVIGDVVGAGAGGAGKAALKFAKNPKQALAETAKRFTSKDKLELQKALIQDMRDSGIQADLGTITGNNAIKWTQSRLAQSGLTGKAFDQLKADLSNQVRQEYKNIAENLGAYKAETSHEAGTILRDASTRIRDAEKEEIRNIYQDATKGLPDESYVDTEKLNSYLNKLEKELAPGQYKSAEQQAVLNAIQVLKRDISAEGKPIFGKVKDLMNNKIGIQDAINYEVQGGAKQLLKGVAKELDRTIISHGDKNPRFAKNYINANKRFSKHAKEFRNKTIDNILKQDQDPAKLLNHFNSIDGIRKIEKILSKTKEGRETFNQLKRWKMEELVGKHLEDNLNHQIKFGTFSNLFKNKKNREILKEILEPSAYQRLDRLQRNTQALADSANKFFNSSQSGTVAADVVAITKGLTSLFSLVHGNPWPLMQFTGGVLATRKLSRLMSDPEFLKLAEEAILSSNQNNNQRLMQVFEQLRPYMAYAFDEAKD